MSCKVAGIMRIFFVFAIASLAVLSCSRERIDIPEEGQIQPGKRTVHMTIVAENPSESDTRTEIAPDGHTPLWSSGDMLGVTAFTQDEEVDENEVFDHSILFAAATEFPALEASFTGDLELYSNPEGNINAYYPGIPFIREMDYPDDYGSITYEEYYYNMSVERFYASNEFFGIHRFELGSMEEGPEGPSAGGGPEILGAGVLVNRYQHPTSTSFDGGSDVLVSKPFSLTDCIYNSDDNYTMPGLEFARMVSVIKLVLNPGENGLIEGQHPEWVALSYNSPEDADGENPVVLSGTGIVQFPATSNDSPVLHPHLLDEWPFSEGASVYACLDEYGQDGAYAISSENSIYLVVYPGVLKAGGKLAVIAANMEDYYSIARKISLKSNIILQPGKITTLTISMTGDEEDIDIGEKNVPAEISFTKEAVDVDQFDRFEIAANIIGKSSNEDEYLEVDEDLFSCTLIHPETGTEINVDYGYIDGTNPSFYCDSEDKVVTVNTPVFEEAGEWILIISYGSSPEDAISSDPCTITVHPAVEIPAALGGSWGLNMYSSAWFEPYRTHRDGRVYLKAYKASQLEELPLYPFYSAFNSEEKQGDFSAFQFFEKIQTIPQQAFLNCGYMTGIVLPSGLTKIEQYAFAMNYRLKTITIPQSVSTIGKEAFRESGLTSVIMTGNTPPTIGAEAFDSNVTIYVPAESITDYQTAWPDYIDQIVAMPTGN